MKPLAISYKPFGKRVHVEKQVTDEKRKQAGIAFPAPREQDNVLIIRLDILAASDPNLVRKGLKKLCGLFEDIDREIIQIEQETDKGEVVSVPLSKFKFTATIGFGNRFFKKLDLLDRCPKFLYDMPDALEIGDRCPYVLQQTDMILQLASNNYSVNKLVLQNDRYLHYSNSYAMGNHNDLYNSEGTSLDILRYVTGWAKISDVHHGFHRTDKRNLMGFYDGISNPYRLNKDTFWISEDEGGKNLADGTIMVFQKIEHDLREWQKLDTQVQERWVGRTKATGLLLGTISFEAEKGIVAELHSSDLVRRKRAMARLSRLIEDQRDPKKRFFDPYDARYMKINKHCPISSHVRKVNPRQPRGKQETMIFRRGYLYMDEQFVNYPNSGLLFISFQKDIKIFEDMKRKLAQLGTASIDAEQPTNPKDYSGQKVLTKNSFDTLTLGGGYYFIPPIPNRKISEIGQQFFS